MKNTTPFSFHQNMKIKNKGKIYPSPSSSSSSSSNGDYLYVLKLLPSAILALAAVLSLEDREVLAYLITRSIKTTTTALDSSSSSSSSSSIIQRKASKKAAANGASGNTNNTHKPPVFYCDCFDCYTSYWFRWDSSPNRELIHQAIEAFEDHLTRGESEEKSKKNGKAKRRDKTARRFADKNQVVAVEDTEDSSADAVIDAAESLPENDVTVAPLSSPGKEATKLPEENEMVAEVSGESITVEEEIPVVLRSPGAATISCSHKGLARKVLPDVLGLFNSRLWSLWSPNA